MNDPLKFHQLDLIYEAYLPENRAAEILDLGCGYGRFIQYLQAKNYSRVSGVDRDTRAIAWVVANVTPSVHLTDDLLGYLAEATGKFDLIVAKDVIYYFPIHEALLYLTAIKRTLKPGGRMVVEVFNGAAFTGPYIMHKDYKIQWIPTEHSIRCLLEDSGFQVTALFGAQHSGKGIKNWLFKFFAASWVRILKLIYLLERGRDAQNPTIFSKSIIVVAEPRDHS